MWIKETAETAWLFCDSIAVFYRAVTTVFPARTAYSIVTLRVAWCEKCTQCEKSDFLDNWRAVTATEVATRARTFPCFPPVSWSTSWRRSSWFTIGSRRDSDTTPSTARKSRGVLSLINASANRPLLAFKTSVLLFTLFTHAAVENTNAVCATCNLQQSGRLQQGQARSALTTAPCKEKEKKLLRIK